MLEKTFKIIESICKHYTAKSPYTMSLSAT